jgi:hypothetical protein
VLRLPPLPVEIVVAGPQHDEIGVAEKGRAHDPVVQPCRVIVARRQLDRQDVDAMLVPAVVAV